MLFSSFSRTLQQWYGVHKRDLPWRETTDPYCIWISEIMLQQTRVQQGLGYYVRFMERFPDVVTLAEADEDEVLKYWQGLGYYSRARNLHRAAKMVADKYDGVFPDVYDGIRALPGVGDYTAAAVASFAYNLPYPVLDGNVFRVIARVFGVRTAIDSTAGKREFAALSGQLMDVDNAALHNQAIMEFGALQCTPVQPDCGVCPLQAECRALAEGCVGELPVKAKKTKVRDRYFNYFFVEYDGKLFLQKRTEKDIWQHLYELPLVETDALYSPEELFEREELRFLWNGAGNVELSGSAVDFKHVLSHQRIFARFFSVRVSQEGEYFGSKQGVPVEELDKYAVSRLTALFFEQKF